MSEEKAADAKQESNLGEKLLKQSCAFGGMLLGAREACREQYRKNEPEPRNRLRIIMDGLMAILGETVRTPMAKPTEASSYQISVSASFIRTHFLVTDLIMNGDIIEASVLVRKQLESLARLNELDSKPLTKLHGKVPNIQNALKGKAGRIYGDLSEIAHFATPRVAEFLHIIEEGKAVGPSLLPTYSERAMACMDLCQFITIYFEQWMIEKLEEWYPGSDRSELMRAYVIMIETALEAGVIQEDKSVKAPAASAASPPATS